ncbi:hypothetical protein AB1L30_17815 [Bremerella sp. JC817]|uniref:hypothetical protein n=1 Tax=Bremerella sp. JC817 TaxID=3231756 RepID=UPI0034574BAD
MSDTPPMFSLIKRGNDSFPRYVIAKADAYRNAVYWDATSRLWHADETKATVFADVTQACWEQHDLLMEAVGERPVHRFIVPLIVEVFGEKPLLTDLRRWLEKAMRIVVDSPKHGLGPKGTVGFIIADVDEMKAV